MGVQAGYAVARRKNFNIDFRGLLDRHPELQIAQDSYNINVTANFGSYLSPSAVLDRHLGHDGAGQPTHLYFHVPLCSYLCHFCNYVKQLARDVENGLNPFDKWTDLLIEESKRYLEVSPWLRKARIESVYIGGGTAALLGQRQLGRLVEHIAGDYALANDCELTLEGNPDNFVNGKIEFAQSLGFNRFSVGVQSLQDEVNQFAGRAHDSGTSLRAVYNLLEAGSAFNVDLMFGLPLQTPDEFGQDVKKLVELDVPTITIYRFRNVDRQRMGIGSRSMWNLPNVRERLEQQGLFPSLERTYAMREMAVRVLLEHDYSPSPCAWWSAPGTYADGNIPRVSKNKWQRYDTMIGYGPGAYGWLTGERREIVQTHNELDISEYLRCIEGTKELPLAFGRLLSERHAVASALGFAFRANQPIQLERFRRQFSVDLLADSPYREVLSDLLQYGLIEQCNGSSALIPTLNGEALYEEIISVYIHGRIGLANNESP